MHKKKNTERESGRKICNFYRRGHHCQYGSSCRFLHIRDDAAPKRSYQVTSRQDPNGDRDKYHLWKTKLKRDPAHQSLTVLLSFWNSAHEILEEGDRDLVQSVPKDLDLEPMGRKHIAFVLTGPSSTILSGNPMLYLKLSLVFLRVITHKAILDCLSVSTYVGALYNFLSGPNGNKAICFFRKVVQQVESEWSHSLDYADLTENLEVMSLALRELLSREHRVIFNDDLLGLIEKATNVLVKIPQGTSTVILDITKRALTDLCALVVRLRGRLQTEDELETSDVVASIMSKYPKDIQKPHHRHDNDKLNITNIQIFPTESEIRSNHGEFLPSTNFADPHFLEDSAERHIDTHFRLLRHDIFGDMKEVLGGFLTLVDKRQSEAFIRHPHLGNVRTLTYLNARVSHLHFEKRKGLEAQISFSQPIAVSKKNRNERRTWWQDSKRLEEGALLCLVTLKDRKASTSFFTTCQKSFSPEDKYGLVSSVRTANVSVKLLSTHQDAIENLLTLFCDKSSGMLIEFPGILAGTFVPILENLQNMQKQARLPFRQWLVPTDLPTGTLKMQPPLYSRRQGFAFSIRPITKAPGETFSIPATASMHDQALVEAIYERTSLDHGQCRGLIAALTHEYSLIQGPPGTGKTYLGIDLMKVLLENGSQAELGPIIIVCYTNHALDQFLEHLLDAGIPRIIRIGGQSKSIRLEGHNLWHISREAAKTRHEGWLIATELEKLEESSRRIQGRIKQLRGEAKWFSLHKYLQYHYRDIYKMFSRVDDEGFQRAGKTEPFDDWAAAATRPSANEGPNHSEIDTIVAKAEKNVWKLDGEERGKLLTFWQADAVKEAGNLLLESITEADKHRQLLASAYDEGDRRTLQNAAVIGITTTGLARRNNVLQRIKSKVVICEEAGEVHEAHIMAALLPHVEHFIQIGDHQQLRPQINNYDLSIESHKGKTYKLDRSQFERLSERDGMIPRIPVAQLNVQRRMRPQISSLIRETLYHNLEDHASVHTYPNVIGLRKDVFWFDHKNYEADQDPEIHRRSHRNDWETAFTHSLVRHIVRQGVYSSDDVAVLTPYVGQLQCLRKKIGEDFEIVLSDRDRETLAKEGFELEQSAEAGSGEVESRATTNLHPLQKRKMSEMLRIATVDNFQGEEAKVIIVSLVRSNSAGRVGFLKTTNRINVLLSRAKHGMYLIGNADTYENVPMWAQVIQMLRGSDSIGPALSLCCPRHLDTEILVRQPEDFIRHSPEGGCELICDQRLPCGHKCYSRCHSQRMHDVVNCLQPCQRYHQPCGHHCQKPTCGQPCGLCCIKINGVKLSCGHLMDGVPCHKSTNIEKLSCKERVKKLVPGCKHLAEVNCCDDVTADNFRCPVDCDQILECGHSCSKKCGKCSRYNSEGLILKVDHGCCTKVCNRQSGTCNHRCPRTCHVEDCGTCDMACEVRCPHSRCRLKCLEPCAPCIEMCTWSCEHQGQCKLPCSAPCNRLPCNKRCSIILQCGHQCPGVCGEQCPADCCQACSHKLDARVDLLEFKSYAEIDLNETPIVVLACGHFFTAESLDGMIGMSEVYDADCNGDFIELRDISGALAQQVPRCPDCNCPIRQYVTQRYNRVINRVVIDEMTKRFVTNGKSQLNKFEEKLEGYHQEIDCAKKKIKTSRGLGPAQDGMHQHGSKAIHGAISDITLILRNIERLLAFVQMLQKEVSNENQPIQKLHDATTNALERNDLVSSMAGLTLHTKELPQNVQISYGAILLLLKIKFLMINFRMEVASIVPDTNFNARSALFEEAHERQIKDFLLECELAVNSCKKNNLPKLMVEAALYYARLTLTFRSFRKSNCPEAQEYCEVATDLIQKAQAASTKCRFQGVEAFEAALEQQLDLLGRDWYAEITSAELETIKKAMVTGRGGIATHSGHWYNCVNGHPFAIGECGMPMELASCPECGASIGGQNHRAVSGVTRAVNME